MLDDSRSRAGRNIIGLLARANPDLDDLANEIYRCHRFLRAMARLLTELTSRHGDLNKAMAQNMEAVVAEFSLDKA